MREYRSIDMLPTASDESINQSRTQLPSRNLHQQNTIFLLTLIFKALLGGGNGGRGGRVDDHVLGENNSHWPVLLVKATVKAAYDIVCLILKANLTNLN